MSSQPASTPAAAADDSFELYDLRVEVVCPPGERIMCGAKEGDYFTLEGEMMYLPPGQGISIYSLGKPEEPTLPSPPPKKLSSSSNHSDGLFQLSQLATANGSPPSFQRLSCRFWPRSSA